MAEPGDNRPLLYACQAPQVSSSPAVGSLARPSIHIFLSCDATRPRDPEFAAGGGACSRSFGRQAALPAPDPLQAAASPAAFQASGGADTGAAQRPAAKAPGGADLSLIAYFALWYLGNYYYNITNKLALKVCARWHSCLFSRDQVLVGDAPQL